MKIQKKVVFEEKLSYFHVIRWILYVSSYDKVSVSKETFVSSCKANFLRSCQCENER